MFLLVKMRCFDDGWFGFISSVPPRVRLEASPPSPIQLNDSVTIACIVEGFYPNDTNLVWLENDSEISLAKAAPVTRNPDGTCSLRSSLEVKATEQRNHSVFTCRVVHDSQPPINENMTLKVGVQPEENGNSHLYGTGKGGFTLSFFWGLFSYPPSKFVFCPFLSSKAFCNSKAQSFTNMVYRV